MNIVLHSTSENVQKKTKNSLQKRFDKLQKQLLKQQKLNQKFEDEIHELVTIYQTYLLQIDTELVKPLKPKGVRPLLWYFQNNINQNSK